MLLSLWLNQNPDCRELLDSLQLCKEIGVNIYYLTLPSQRFHSLENLINLKYGEDGDCNYISLLSVIGEERPLQEEKSVYLWVNPLLLIAHDKLSSLEKNDVNLCAFTP